MLVAKRALYFEVSKQIQNSIMRGEWESGQKLPSIIELAARFSVSKAVMREACSLLVGTGVLELRHGDGTYVKTLTLDTIMPPIQAALLLGASDLYSLLEVGLWLERGVVSVAAARRTERQVRDLAEALFVMEADDEQYASIVLAEREFHGVVFEASNNLIAVNLLRTLYPSLSSALELFADDNEVRELIVTVHQAMYGSIAAHNAEAAERQVVMYRHALQERVLEYRAQASHPSKQ